jgi:hypothetical protein
MIRDILWIAALVTLVLIAIWGWLQWQDAGESGKRKSEETDDA